LFARNGIFGCGDRATEIAARDNIYPQRPKEQVCSAKSGTNGLSELDEKTPRFGGTGWWGRNRSKLGAHHPVIEPVSNLGLERDFSIQIISLFPQKTVPSRNSSLIVKTRQHEDFPLSRMNRRRHS
jgi:hypothetical protein